ncbi:MAG: hypothetical protein MUF22_04195 [Chitinispirillaceae bacterium]|jgi:hypothetical protein|nr:hypothetical protein [Chitinispirillaceae bacterium]
MTGDADTMLLEDLRDSFRLQRGWYAELGALVDRILSRLILSRGDFAGVRNEFAEKQRLLECIEKERARTSGPVSIWQEQKTRFAASSAAGELDRELEQTGAVIRKFLDGEEQLKRYLERMMTKAPAAGPTP